ncbi:hypothetical protein CD32_07095 [Lysinibacillus odysseyi 34hs-1 = NBRC 100172]|uniref:Uncharacterized protein n=1 Tax=Lysinibacillus odysseyi 34hs-1 = NBRC 100172 TaxID=1220589 RepID=A0A0A3IRS3_9BACI|nr:hypothetical protein CD32_07095 [Lysinibacillus odysseyi 34hs-1 = NBRC 100172]
MYIKQGGMIHHIFSTKILHGLTKKGWKKEHVGNYYKAITCKGRKAILKKIPWKWCFFRGSLIRNRTARKVITFQAATAKS